MPELVIREEMRVMDVVHPRCAGIDISKTDAKVCVRVQRKGGKAACEVRTWEATSSRILELGEWLAGQAVTLVVMEATSTYWRPFWHLLTEAGLNVMLVNPRRARQIPGRKSDVADCQWLADLGAHGLLRASFVPPKPVQQLRDLVRTRTQFTRARAQESTRVEKLLEDTGIKLSATVSDIMGVSGRRMLDALVAGERDPEVLASLGTAGLRASEDELTEALTGRFTDHHALLVSLRLEVIDSYTAKIAVLDRAIAAFFDEGGVGEAPGGLSVEERQDWARARELLMTIPGVSDRVAEQVLAEMGPDMSVFDTPKHLVSWAGASPGLNQSAGRAKHAKALSGNKFLKGALGTVALNAARHGGTYLHAHYVRVSSRRGPAVALVAVENTVLTAIWHMLTTGQPYQDPGDDYYLRRKPGAAIRKSVKSLQAVGYTIAVNAAGVITATPTPAQSVPAMAS
jgi:transposase